jgi:hypothetical protein
MKVLSSVNSLKVRWITRASGFHAVHSRVHVRNPTLDELDIERVVTKGTYGPAQDASAWMREPIDLSKVDEVGFVDLIPGSGHGAGGYVNVASFEVYGKPVKRK